MVPETSRTALRRSRRSILVCIGCALLLAVPFGRSAAQGGSFPVIVVQPKTQQVLYSQRATLSVVATGATSYQWYYGESGDDRVPILNATSSTYVSEQLFDTYRFWVRVSNAFGSVDSGTARVDVEKDAFPGIYTTRLPLVKRGGPAFPFFKP